MKNREYHALLNTLLQVQSEDELIALVQQHPELLSEAFLTYVQQQLNRMNPLEAMELLQRLMMLAAIVQASTQIAAPAPQPADRLDIPDHIPPSTDRAPCGQNRFANLSRLVHAPLRPCRKPSSAPSERASAKSPICSLC